MRVLIVGAGAQGAAMAHYLARSDAIDEVVCADVDPTRAGEARRFARSRKALSARLDAGNARGVSRALEHADLVVNAALPRFNLSLTRAAAIAGVHYQDLAAEYRAIDAQLRLSKTFARKGRTALLQCGGSPGITNVLARDAADSLDTVESVRLRLISRIDASRPLSLWSVAVALDDMEEPPAVFRNGRVERVPPFSDEEVFDFPPPFGRQPVLQHMHEEPLTLGRFLGKGIRYVDLKMGGHHVYQMKEAWSLGLLGRKPVAVDGVRVVPRDLLVALNPPALTPASVVRLLKSGVLRDATGCHALVVEGAKAGGRKVLRYAAVGPSLRAVQEWMPGATNLSYRVGVGAALFTEMIARGQVSPSGAFPPECLDADARAIYIERLKLRHLPFDVRES